MRRGTSLQLALAIFVTVAATDCGSGGLTRDGGSPGTAGTAGIAGVSGTGGFDAAIVDASRVDGGAGGQAGTSAGGAAGGTNGPGGIGGVGAGGGSGTAGNGSLQLELVAGDIGGPGNVNATGVAARFNGPRGIAVDVAGNFYVADTSNDTIRKITAAGVVTTLAGSPGAVGSADAAGAAARFNGPMGIAVDGAGTVYVADNGNNTIRQITAAGVVTTLAGSPGMTGTVDGTGAMARFFGPTAVAVDASGNVYVTDRSNYTIRKVTAAGITTTIAGSPGLRGGTNGTGAAARFYGPQGIAVDAAGNLYVADWDEYCGDSSCPYGAAVRRVTAAGVVTTLAGSSGKGSADGTGAAALFDDPRGLAVDAAGNVYVADTANSTLRKITAAGAVSTLAGAATLSGSVDATGAVARFANPTAVTVDGAGTVYVVDTGNDTIRKMTAAGAVTTLAGAAPRPGSTDATGASARFYYPAGVAVDPAGTLYVADNSNSTIRKITAGGVTTTLAGSAGMPGITDGTGAAARFFLPYGLALDGAGSIYVADTGNDTVRKLSAAGMVTTLAGMRAMGSVDGTGSAARFNSPYGLAVDVAGNVYVADTNNQTVRKITASGEVTTLAGKPGMSGITDGTGASARFRGPYAVVVDAAGTLYVADAGNHAIRTVSSAGVVTTLAGLPGTSGSADGTGTTARFYNPSALAMGGAGNLYVTDTTNHAIRMVTPAGVTTTVAGAPGAAGVVLGSTPGFDSPSGIAVAGTSLVITDANAVLLLRNGAQ